jgi:hypothetical protein
MTDFDEIWHLWGLYCKLSGKFSFGLYQSDVNSASHETQIELYWFPQKCLIMREIYT